MKLFLFTISVCLSFLSFSQIISQFTWDSGPVTTADIGPNATSISGSAISDVNGTNGTNGLNAGLPKLNLDMIIPGSPTFDVNGIDISFDYQREESGGTFWRRGSSVIISGCNQFSVSYRIDDGAGGYNTVNSGNAYNIPNDDIFRRYRFIYLPITGQGYLMVDGTVVWTNDGPDNRNLYWTGAGNVTVGSGMDGTGFNKTFLDSLVVANVVTTALPVELIDFQAFRQGDDALLNWSTSSERNNEYFEIYKSTDGVSWSFLNKTTASGNSETEQKYSFLDKNVEHGIIYYELRQTDLDGHKENLKIVSLKKMDKPLELKVYPNPCKDFLHIVSEDEIDPNLIVLCAMDGRIATNFVHFSSAEPNSLTVDVTNLNSGIYFLTVNDQAAIRFVRL